MKNFIIYKFYLDLINVYNLELYISKDNEGNNVFKFHDLQGGNFGGIEQDFFQNLAETIETLDPFHQDYIYGSLEDRAEKNEVIEKEDWDLTAKRFLESDVVATVLEEINPTLFEELSEEKLKYETKDMVNILDVEEMFCKRVCQKYVDTMSKELLFEKDGKILHIFIEDEYIDLKEKGKITKYNYEKYLDSNFEVYQYHSYKELLDRTIKDEITYDLNDLALFEDNKWSFYLTFEELKQLGYGFMIKEYYPLLEKYIVPNDKTFDFYNHFSLEQLNDFENSLHLYYETDNIITDTDGSLVSKDGTLFNLDIIALSEGVRNYEDFVREFETKISSRNDMIFYKIVEYLRENNLGNFKDFADDGNESLYHFSDFYKEIMNKLGITYKYIYTTEKEPGEYTTVIEFDNENVIELDTKENDNLEYITHNINFLTEKYDSIILKKTEKEIEAELECLEY